MKRFGGWEPTVVTDYFYDADGRLIRSVATSEVEWDDDERAKILALVRCERMTCSGCGGWLPETLVYEPEDYVVDPPTPCAKCKVLAIYGDGQADDEKHMHTLRWRADLKTKPAATTMPDLQL